MWIAMGGYKAASDIDRLVVARHKAMDARAERGLPITSRVPMSHKVIRDQTTGKAICLEVNESKRRLWNDLAEVLLDGIAWYKVEEELYNRYGHIRDNGERYYPGYMYRLIMKPLFWGHIARHHASAGSKNGYKTGAWIYDENEPMPEGATIYHNTHEPVWTGELAEKVKAEIRRRSETVRGGTDPQNTHRFSGLGVCAKCGSFWGTHVQKKKNYRGLLCPAAKSNSPILPDCENTRIMTEKRMVKLMNGYLKQMLKRQSTDIFNEDNTLQQEYQSRVEELDREIAALEIEARTLIREQAKAGTELRKIYQEELTQINTRLKNMKLTRDTMQSKVTVKKKKSVVQGATLQELADLSLEAFWNQESRYINQILHRLLGKKRFLLLDGEIIGVAEVNRRQRSHT